MKIEERVGVESTFFRGQLVSGEYLLNDLDREMERWILFIHREGSYCVWKNSSTRAGRSFNVNGSLLKRSKTSLSQRCLIKGDEPEETGLEAFQPLKCQAFTSSLSENLERVPNAMTLQKQVTLTPSCLVYSWLGAKLEDWKETIDISFIITNTYWITPIFRMDFCTRQ